MVVSEAVYRLVQSEVTIIRELEARLKGIHEPVARYVVDRLATP
ncbi:MAG: hypothetical protein WBV23_15535 [Desulfobaccales bacterium]